MRLSTAMNLQHATRVAQKSLWHRLLSDGTWLALESILSRGLTILAMMFAAGLLGSKAFGQLGAVQTTLIMLSGLLADALRITAARQIAVQGTDAAPEVGRIVPLVFLTTLGAGLLLIVLMYPLAPWIAAQLLGADTLTTPLQLGLILLLCEALNGVCLGILTGLREFRVMALAGGVSGISLLLLVSVGADHGVTGMVSALTGASMLGLSVRCISILKALRRLNIGLRIELHSNDINTMWRLSLPALIGGACFAPVNWLVTVMLVQSDNGHHELGLIGVAMQWFSLLLFLPNVVGATLLPHLSGAFGRGDARDLRAALWLGVRVNLLVSVPAIGIIALLSDFIMSWYGGTYAQGGPVLILFALAAGAAALQNLFTNLLASVDRMWHSLFTQITWAMTYLLCAHLSLRLELGAAGIAAAMAVACAARLLHTVLLARDALANLNPPAAT